MGNRKHAKYVFTQTNLSVNKKYQIPTGEVGFYRFYPYFSFRYYHINHSKFTHKGFSKNDFNKFFERIHRMSQYTWKDIFGDLKKFFRAHPVNWSETTQKRGFSHLGRILSDCPVYQFEIFEECRIFGFFNPDNVFKIVWIDRNHEVYPSK